MTKISLREIHQTSDNHAAVISFDDGGEYSINVKNPFTSKQEERLQWYYEEYLKFPFANTEIAKEVVSSLGFKT